MTTTDTATDLPRAGCTRTGGPRAGRRRRAVTAGALLLAAVLAVAGCGSSGGSSASSKAVAPTGRQDAGSQAGTGAAPGASGDSAAPGTTSSGGASRSGGAAVPKAAPVYLARTATLTVRTPHVEAQLDAARTMAADAGGYAGDEDTAVDAQGHARSSIQLRVPAAAYDGLLTRLARLGTLLDRKVSVEDVTGQVVDVQSRIRSQQASVARVRALMDRASSLSDVVSLESELSTRESALESLEAQQDALRSRTDMATITLRLTEPPAKPAPPHAAAKKHDGFWTTVGHALGAGWHAFCLTVRTVLVVAAVLLPFAVLALLLWSGYRLVRRRLPGVPAGRRVAPSSLRAPDGGRPRVPDQALPVYPGAAGKPGGEKTGGTPGRTSDEPEAPPAE